MFYVKCSPLEKDLENRGPNVYNEARLKVVTDSDISAAARAAQIFLWHEA